MKEFLGRLICGVTRRHKRGKRLLMVTSTSTTPVNTFACPRCGAQWTRKAKA